jgi:hypothetical protein
LSYTQALIKIKLQAYRGSYGCYSFLALEISVVIVILGISAFYHDSSAALVVDGDIVTAA